MSDENQKAASLLAPLFTEEGWEGSDLPPGPCPDEETVGALLAGTLPEDERKGVAEHLASCERCYEGYASAFEFLVEEAQEDEDWDVEAAAAKVAAFRPAAERAEAGEGKGSGPVPARPVGSTSGGGYRWLGLAAALALVAIPAWWMLRPHGMPSLDGVVAHFSPREQLEVHLLMPDPNRGPGDPEPIDTDSLDSARTAFQAGGSAFDLFLAAQSGDIEKMETYAAELADLAGKVPTDSPIHGDLQKLTEDLRDPRIDRKAAQLRAQKLAHDVEPIFFDSASFALGRLIESARLKAFQKDSAYFSDRFIRDGLRVWRKEDPLIAREPSIQEVLADLEKAWDARPRSFKDLDQALQAVQDEFGFYRVSLDAGLNPKDP